MIINTSFGDFNQIFPKQLTAIFAQHYYELPGVKVVNTENCLTKSWQRSPRKLVNKNHRKWPKSNKLGVNPLEINDTENTGTLTSFTLSHNDR